MRDVGMIEIMSKVLKKKTGLDHYDIYEYKGWTLRESQEVKMEDSYDQNLAKWTKCKVLKTHIVWGFHKPCDLRGVIMVGSNKVSCAHCKTMMPQEVFINMTDAMNFMKTSLETE